MTGTTASPRRKIITLAMKRLEAHGKGTDALGEPLRTAYQRDGEV
jgi:hypothetical protein